MRSQEVNATECIDADWCVRAGLIRQRFERFEGLAAAGRFTPEEVAQLGIAGIIPIAADDAYRNVLLSFALDGSSDLPPSQYGYYSHTAIAARVSRLRPIDGLYLCDTAYQSWIAAEPPPDPVYNRYGIETQVNERECAATLLQDFRNIGDIRAKYFRVPVLPGRVIRRASQTR